MAWINRSVSCSCPPNDPATRPDTYSTRHTDSTRLVSASKAVKWAAQLEEWYQMFAHVDLNALRSGESSFLHGEHSLRAVTIGAAFREQNLDVALLPRSKDMGAYTSAAAVLEQIETELQSLRPKVVLLSADSQFYFLAITKALEWKRAFGVQVWMGGAHFQEPASDGGRLSPITRPISFTLALDNKGLSPADMIEQGKGVNAARFYRTGESLPGLFRKDGETVTGAGVSNNPALSAVPVSKWVDLEGKVILQTAAFNRCASQCAFCVSYAGYRHPPQAVHKALTEAMRTPVSGLDLIDPAALTPHNLNYYQTALHNMSGFPLALNIDTHYLSDRAHEAEVHSFLRRFPGTSIFIGRETPNAQIAATIGARFLKREVSQEMLDAERENILRLISFSDKEGLQLKIYLSYIATPFDMDDARDAIADEIAAYFGAAEETRIVPYVFDLAPFPGTELALKMADLYNHNPRYFYTEGEQFWSKMGNSIGPTSTDMNRRLRRRGLNFQDLPSARDKEIDAILSAAETKARGLFTLLNE